MNQTPELDLSAELPPEHRAAAERLAELLSHQQLSELLGTQILNAFRSLARQALGRTPRLTKASLAAGLLLRHGNDLFVDPQLRRKLSRKLGLSAPGRWHPGKPGALHFVRAAGFDERFSGRPSDAAPSDVEWLRGRTLLPDLADFQKEVLEKCRFQLNRRRSKPRAVLTLPTGGGKTRVAVEYVKRHLTEHARAERRTVLWVAHTAELLEQAVEALRSVWANAIDVPELRIDRRFGVHGRGSDADEDMLAVAQDTVQVVVATPQRLLNDLQRWSSDEATSPRASRWRQRLGLVVIDEAHRAAAPQYRRLLEGLIDGEEPHVLGLTATPFRREYMQAFPELGTKELILLFRTLVEPDQTLGEHPREVLQQRQVLARPRERRIQTGRLLGMRELFEHAEAVSDAESLEQIDRRLMEQADEAVRRSKVFAELLAVSRDPAHRVLYFGPSVRDAEIMAFMLCAQGVPAGFISGQSRPPHRRQLIDSFRDGDLRVLCNCEVLTTGFDAPQVSHVVIARPTVSHVLFEQMVGRGLRGPRFGGTDRCEVLYFVDDIDSDWPRLGFRAWREVWGLSAPDPADAD